MDVETNMDRYAAFKRKQKEVSDMLSDTLDTISVLNMSHVVNVIRTLSDKIKNESFKIQVLDYKMR